MVSGILKKQISIMKQMHENLRWNQTSKIKAFRLTQNLKIGHWAIKLQIAITNLKQMEYNKKQFKVNEMVFKFLYNI